MNHEEKGNSLEPEDIPSMDTGSKPKTPKLGSLDRVTRVVSVKVYLATQGDFYNQPIVADAASELLRDVFGEDKMSVRSVL
jgi:hypothetical protein